MFIQWYPGHMTKAMRMMENEVRLCDGVVYVLDARAPFACLSDNLESLFKNRPVVYCMNKYDLVDGAEFKAVENKFRSEGKRVVLSVGTSEKTAKTLYGEIMASLKAKIDRNREKGVKKPLRVMVCGLPNTGKSTVINLLSGAKRAKTGDKAGVTKDKQWLKVKDLELLDTPGTTSPSFSDQKNAAYLAFIGSINDDILDFEELSLALIEYLMKNKPETISIAYGINAENDAPAEIFEKIAKKKGALKKGGETDGERTGNLIISDLRKGKLGKILFI